ncbi:phosphatidate cytidylyltransferase [Acidaminobacter sp. JC074]|uniref:phosphatidate cytidylyltransferase n=1 Tax=Acidaminobacter sp. JC074 TaxID=2530199 RepID=UPI001F0D45A0|nr:phosphatidate cytidylyltransferase [Acidaminobacter sp. JC074]MCH4888757.1 phosphatidate cytidylyltransferase [Acidaminobacter sp. JC074]
MLVRIISSIVALPLLFFFVLKGGLYLEAGVLVISMIALYEIFNALKVNYKPVAMPSYLMLIVFSYAYHFNYFTLLSGAITVYIALLCFIFVFDEERHFSDIGVTFLGAAYIIFFLYHVVLLSHIQPAYMIWFIFIASWGADTGAYFTGRFFGKRKLAPTISPKKTVEGAVGGVITAALLCALLSVYFEPSLIYHSIAIGVVGSLISIVGDLTASKIKREMGIKDFGHIMPGHGGVLDRFDSVILVTPFIYYAIKLIVIIK